MQLGLELINVFAADIVVTNTVGSGELMKAVLQKKKWGIGICRTATHKKVVLDGLKSFAKLMQLVDLSKAPAKTADLMAYEKNLQNEQAVSKTPSLITPKPKPAPLPSVPETTPATPLIVPKQPAPAPAALPPGLAAFGSSIV